MDYKFPGLKVSVDINLNEISLTLDDSEGYISPEFGADSYMKNISIDQYLCDNPIYNSNGHFIKHFMEFFDNELREFLPSAEEYDSYKEIEGYWECMGIVRVFMEKNLKQLEESEKYNR